ncbi:hypothetical protein [Alicyclobacillus fodiniaquatilis]|uniref:DUF3303 domain-containing protein n=1 Tax=Alicyclobacillus fodiniaquatilis TaxID=1661150 RepID=A0ABW4JCH9_9BACL
MNHNDERLYFACRGNMVDVTVQRERWFGAVWSYDQGERHLIAYWFEDTDDKVYEEWMNSPWYEDCTVLFTPFPINQVYQQVREAMNTPSGLIDSE